MVFGLGPSTPIRDLSIPRTILAAMKEAKSGPPVTLDPAKIPLMVKAVKNEGLVEDLTQFMLRLEDASQDTAAVKEHLLALKKNPFWASIPDKEDPRTLVTADGKPLFDALLEILEVGDGKSCQALLVSAKRGEPKALIANRLEVEEALYRKTALDLASHYRAREGLAIVQDMKLRIALVKTIVENPYDRVGNISRYKITDPQVLIDIAMMEADKKGTDISDYIHEYGITDQKILMTIAIKAARNKPDDLRRLIRHYKITDPQVLINMALLEVGKKGTDILAYIHEYGITDQKTLMAIATEAARNNPDHIGRYIRHCHLADEKDRYAIAQIIAGGQGCGLGQFISDFEITDQKFLIDLASQEVKNHPYSGIRYFHKFGITDYDARLTIAEEAVSRVSRGRVGCDVAQWIANFQLEKPDLLRIARLIALNAPLGISQYIGNFNIEDPAVLQDIAEMVADKDWSFGPYFSFYRIKDQSLIFKMAEKYLSVYVSPIDGFGIEDERLRIALAKKFSEKHDLSRCISSFAITDQKALVAIATCAAKKWPCHSDNIQQYQIEDSKARVAIAEQALMHYPSQVFDRFDNYAIVDEHDRLFLAKKLAVLMGDRVWAQKGRFALKNEALQELECLCIIYKLKNNYPITEHEHSLEVMSAHLKEKAKAIELDADELPLMKRMLLVYTFMLLKEASITPHMATILKDIILYRNNDLALRLLETFCGLKDKEAYYALVTQAHFRLPMIL